MESFKRFIQKEFLLIISGILALVSCFLVPVTNYSDYINTDVIGILFCLMMIIAGFAENNVLAKILAVIIRGGRLTTQKAAFILIIMSFFGAMIFTNDAVLIAFVPITIALFKSSPKYMGYIIVLQTAAANLGSMATPIGNPQNLHLFSFYEMSALDFFETVLPFAGISLILLVALVFTIKNEVLEVDYNTDIELGNKGFIFLYLTLLILCLLAVFGILDVLVIFASVCVVIVITEPRLFSRVDYGLLVTFAFFFIFIGNISELQSVTSFITNLLDGNEMLAAVLCSQITSNVPAAVMLSGFTSNAHALVIGTNIGGLGTIIASLASVISFRIYIASTDAKPFKYLCGFTIVNVVLLIVLYISTLIIC